MAATALKLRLSDEMTVGTPEHSLAQLSSDVGALLLADRAHGISPRGQIQLDLALDAFVELGASAGELNAEIDDYLSRYPPAKN